jgi:hypothetical protein
MMKGDLKFEGDRMKSNCETLQPEVANGTVNCCDVWTLRFVRDKPVVASKRWRSDGKVNGSWNTSSSDREASDNSLALRHKVLFISYVACENWTAAVPPKR